ncbi:hypothetical protein BDR04DRAFT_865041 [Suillus decipiens]|nr:hypothetical protein BDR04DRAFT_865041 [Suillus decipiens]
MLCNSRHSYRHSFNLRTLFIFLLLSTPSSATPPCSALTVLTISSARTFLYLGEHRAAQRILQ